MQEAIGGLKPSMREHWTNRSIEKNPFFLIFFSSKSTPQDLQDTIKIALGVSVVQQYEKYLGLLSFIGRKKKESFENIKQRV